MKRVLTLLSFMVFSQLVLFAEDQKEGKYYFSKTVEGSFDEVTGKVKGVLKKYGFGTVTELDMDESLKEKLEEIVMQPYRILGVCNPGFAYKTLQAEENIGLFLPCKVVLRDLGDNKTEVVMINPSAVMKMLGNDELMEVADKVTERFKMALAEL